jgi:hypothetical protein
MPWFPVAVRMLLPRAHVRSKRKHLHSDRLVRQDARWPAILHVAAGCRREA